MVGLVRSLFKEGVVVSRALWLEGGRCGCTWAAVAVYDRVHVIIVVIISEDVKWVVVAGLSLMNPWQLPDDCR